MKLSRVSILKYIFSCTFALCLAASCSKRETAPPSSNAEISTSPPAERAIVDACSLLASEEIQSIQGEPLVEAKPLTRSQGGLSISQCYFALPAMENSISLQVMQRGTGPGAREARELWNQTFGQEAPLMNESSKTGAPRRIEGLGDEAYWVGNEMIGALNVLHGNRYLTISVGGAGDQAVKIEKCTALARLILKRL